jgi:hypothetical protein
LRVASGVQEHREVRGEAEEERRSQRGESDEFEENQKGITSRGQKRKVC